MLTAREEEELERKKALIVSLHQQNESNNRWAESLQEDVDKLTRRKQDEDD